MSNKIDVTSNNIMWEALISVDKLLQIMAINIMAVAGAECNTVIELTLAHHAA